MNKRKAGLYRILLSVFCALVAILLIIYQIVLSPLSAATPLLTDTEIQEVQFDNAAPFVKSVEPVYTTQQGNADFDDPYIWIHPTNPRRSLVFGTDKKASEILVFSLEGETIQVLEVGANPNNIDGRDNYVFANLRDGERVFVGKVNPNYDEDNPPLLRLADIHTNDENFIQDDSYGFAIGKFDGHYYLFETPSSRPHLRQYRIDIEGDLVTTTLVRDFGPREKQIEGLVVDEENGRLLGTEEEGIGLVYDIDPTAPTTPIATFAQGKHAPPADMEGIAFYKTGKKSGYVLLSSQGSNRVFIYDRQTFKLLAVVNFHTQITDGLDVTSTPIPGLYDCGFAVLQNDPDETFFNFYDWCEVVGK